MFTYNQSPRSRQCEQCRQKYLYNILMYPKYKEKLKFTGQRDSEQQYGLIKKKKRHGGTSGLLKSKY